MAEKYPRVRKFFLAVERAFTGKMQEIATALMPRTPAASEHHNVLRQQTAVQG